MQNRFMFALHVPRSYGRATIAALIIGALILPIARAATCDCYDRQAAAGHCHDAQSPSLVADNLEHDCDAMLACCLLDQGPVLNDLIGALDDSGIGVADVLSPTFHSAVRLAPPKPPPRA